MRREAQRHFCRRHRIQQVLLVGVDEKDGIEQLVLRENLHEFVAGDVGWRGLGAAGEWGCGERR